MACQRMQLITRALFGSLIVCGVCVESLVPPGDGDSRYRSLGSPLCGHCLSALESAGSSWVQRCPSCERDGRVVNPGLDSGACDDCPAATTGASIPVLSSISALHLAAGPLWEILKTWKKRCSRSLAAAVTTDAAGWRPWTDALKRIQPDCLVPIPQSFGRSWKLGRNPAAELAIQLHHGGIGGESGLLIDALVNQTPHLSPQGELSSRRERENAARSYEIRRPSRDRLRDRTVLLVDDFVTTGNTVKAAARALIEEGGARSVHVAALALRPRIRVGRSESGAARFP